MIFEIMQLCATLLLCATGRLECLVNNAAVLSIAPLEWHRPSHVTQELRINLEGVMLTTLALIPFIRKNKGTFCSPIFSNIPSVNC